MLRRPDLVLFSVFWALDALYIVIYGGWVLFGFTVWVDGLVLRLLDVITLLFLWSILGMSSVLCLVL